MASQTDNALPTGCFFMEIDGKICIVTTETNFKKLTQGAMAHRNLFYADCVAIPEERPVE